MNTDLLPALLATDAGREADSILRACVHCGLCTATCPSYQVLGNELDSPRGRIYLVKQALEGRPVSAVSLHHLDTCLGCRACETTCPSGVAYHRLYDIGRQYIELRVSLSPGQRVYRWLLRRLLLSRRWFAVLLQLGRAVRPLLPKLLARSIPPSRPPLQRPATGHRRRVVLFEGCVQPAVSPQTNAAAALVLDRLGVGCDSAVSSGEGCCGALSYHSGDREQGLAYARANIDAWMPRLDSGAESIVFTASGCSAFVKDYPTLLGDDPSYAEPARRVVAAMRDISEVLHDEELDTVALRDTPRAVLQCPCTLQHALGLADRTRHVLERLGFDLPAVRDDHLCCGSAGSYSLYHPAVAGQLRDKKLAALAEHLPEIIMTANIGCQKHLSERSDVGVVHWIEVVARGLKDQGGEERA